VGGQWEKSPKNSKNRPKNSTFKPLFTIFVPCLKIQGGHGPPLPTPMGGQEHSQRGSNIQLVFQEQESLYFHIKAKTWMGHGLYFLSQLCKGWAPQPFSIP